jgi:hypothetical protein
VRRYAAERKKAGLSGELCSPILLPDYVNKQVKDKRLENAQLL